MENVPTDWRDWAAAIGLGIALGLLIALGL